MSRFLVDEALPESLVLTLRQAGHDAEHVREAGMAGATDDEVFEHAQASSALLLTPDLEFGDTRRYPPGSHAGILVIRMPRVAAEAMVQEVMRLLAGVDEVDLSGVVAVLETGHMRIRRGS
ncbi:MAG TPA: DUF5615 family PIN-like protein [Dehalococcoidia bacterium]|nr:DUF5615 family PIN-like protein [Dehalococcoidia bacterium]